MGFVKTEWTRSNDDYWRRTVSSAMQTIVGPPCGVDGSWPWHEILCMVGTCGCEPLCTKPFFVLIGLVMFFSSMNLDLINGGRHFGSRFQKTFGDVGFEPFHSG